MAQTGPHISIKAETVAQVYGFNVTNSLIASVIVTALFILIALYYHSESKKKDKSLVFYALHGTVEALYGLFKSILGKNLNAFFSLLGAFFFFIILNNWFGLLPFVNSYYVKPVAIPAAQTAQVIEENKGTETVVEPGVIPGEEVKETHAKEVPLLRGATADLNTTFALALLTVLFTQYMGFKYLGLAAHLKKYASGIGLLEAFSEVSRILSFSFRLFGNIFAGEVMLAVVAFLLPLWLIYLGSPFFLFEVFVAFIQAVVFTMLSAVFINLAIQKHH